MGNPPANADGDAGDPVFAVDHAAEVVYMSGTSPRNNGHNGIPLWKSTDGGITFGTPIVVRNDIMATDKEWIAVDEGTDTGQHDVYLTCLGYVGMPPNYQISLTTSTDGGATWSAPLDVNDGGSSPIVVVDANHVAYVVWLNVGTPHYSLKVRSISNHGASLGAVQTIAQLGLTGSFLGLKRSNTTADNDTFDAYPFPVVAANPVRAGHLYVAYPDQGSTAGDKSDVFLAWSTDSGTTWHALASPVNTVSANDQWMPVLAVKPDGTKLFVGWYDRRNDANNSLIDVYGRWGTIATDGSVTMGTEFRITSASFPPVFVGTFTGNRDQGHYDPVYPPGAVNLHWWYPDWTNDVHVVTVPDYQGHVGEYNGTTADTQYVYVTWTDNRLPSVATLYGRTQGDIRFVRLNWP